MGGVTAGSGRYRCSGGIPIVRSCPTTTRPPPGGRDDGDNDRRRPVRDTRRTGVVRMGMAWAPRRLGAGSFGNGSAARVHGYPANAGTTGPRISPRIACRLDSAYGHSRQVGRISATSRPSTSVALGRVAVGVEGDPCFERTLGWPTRSITRRAAAELVPASRGSACAPRIRLVSQGGAPGPVGSHIRSAWHNRSF